MTDLSTRTLPDLLGALLLHGLRVPDDRLNAVAAEMLARQGVLPARRLVLEAAAARNSPAHRVRALGVLARIASAGGREGLGAANMADLTALLLDRNGRVREAALGVLDAAAGLSAGATSGVLPDTVSAGSR